MSNVGDNANKALAGALNQTLANCYALYIKTKNFHWHVKGPHFHDYHLLLDTQAQQILAITDAIAERVRKIGHRSLTSIGSIAQAQTIADSDAEGLSAEAMLKEIRGDNQALVAQLKDTKALAEEAGDNATDGLIDDWTDEAEERVWFLGETLAR